MAASLFQQVLGSILDPVAKAAANQVANSAQVQGALAGAQDAAKKAEMIAYVGGFMAVTTYLFYVVPRMEKPVPRAWRKR